MPAHARKDIVREGEVATYHCWSRCVQKAFLCGYDPETGRDFHYRCGWIEDLLAYVPIWLNAIERRRALVLTKNPDEIQQRATRASRASRGEAVEEP